MDTRPRNPTTTSCGRSSHRERLSVPASSSRGPSWQPPSNTKHVIEPLDNSNRQHSSCPSWCWWSKPAVPARTDPNCRFGYKSHWVLGVVCYTTIDNQDSVFNVTSNSLCKPWKEVLLSLFDRWVNRSRKVKWLAQFHIKWQSQDLGASKNGTPLLFDYGKGIRPFLQH